MKQKGKSPLAASKKMAPRSSNQFRIGPPFGPTEVQKQIVNEKMVNVIPEISARIDRGFDLIDGGWVGYKRNYFTLVACFHFADQPLDICLKSHFLYKESGTLVKIKAFKISLRHTCLDPENFQTSLVQHTAKRDRGPQFQPPEYLVVPGELPAHEIMRELANIRNGPKISFYDNLFYMLKDEREVAAENKRSILSTYPKEGRIAMIARYERIQFQTFPIGAKRFGATNQDLTFLVVQLMGVKENGTEVVLATTTTAPLTVRGRSPLNYTSATSSRVTKREETAHKDVNIDSTLKRRAKIHDIHGDEQNHEDEENHEREAYPSKKRSKALGTATSGRTLQRNKALENRAHSLIDTTTLKRVQQIRRLPPLQLVVPQVNFLSEPYSPSSSSSQSISNMGSSHVKNWAREASIGCELASDFSSDESPLKKGSSTRRASTNAEKNHEYHSKNSFLLRLPIGHKNCLKIALVEESSNSFQGLDPIHDVIQIMSDDDLLNTSLAEDSSKSEESQPAIDPFFENHDLSVNCPLGCFPSFPTSNRDFFLLTSTPFVRKSFESSQSGVHGYALCKHGFKRTVKRAESSRSYGSEDLVSDNYDSSFLKLRNCLDKIKRNIHMPELALSSLTSLDSSNSLRNVLWEELLAREAVKLAHQAS